MVYMRIFFFKSRQKKKDKITYATSQSLRKYTHKNISNLYAKPSIVKVKTTWQIQWSIMNIIINSPWSQYW